MDAHPTGKGLAASVAPAFVLDRLKAGVDPRSDLAQAIGSKGYHDDRVEQRRYPFQSKK